MMERVKGLLQKEKERRDRLKELQIDYEFPGYQAIVDAKKPAPVTPKEKTKENKDDKQKKKAKKNKQK